MDANSTPTAPAPTTIKVFGISGSWRIERFVRIVLWSGSMPGSDFASDPLTIRIFDAFRMLLDDFVFSREDVGPVDFQPADFETQLGAILELIVNLGVMQQHLGGNAANVQAGPAQVGILFHNNDFQAKLARADRRHVPARTASDNRHIVLCHS